MRGACFAFLLWALLSNGVQAQIDEQFGVGEAPRHQPGGEYRDILVTARAPTIGALGNDALRFSSQPALGGVGYIITVRGNGRVNVAWYYGHPALGWRRTRQASFRIPEAEYERVVGRVDELLAEGASELRRTVEGTEEEAIVVCSDGPGYRTERIRGGEATWYRPWCSGANDEIARYLTSWAFVELGY